MNMIKTDGKASYVDEKMWMHVYFTACGKEK